MIEDQKLIEAPKVDQQEIIESQVDDFFSGADVADFLNDFGIEPKASADTIINEEGEEEIVIDNPVSPNAEIPKTDTRDMEAELEAFLLLRNTLQSLLMAFSYGDPNSYEKFGLEKWQFALLKDAYRPYMQTIGKIPPWAKLMIVEGVIIGLGVVKVKKAKREAQEIAFAKENAGEAVSDELQDDGKIQGRSIRSKKAWLIDENGFFVNKPNGTYIKTASRKDAPDFKSEKVLKMLEKYNGKEVYEIIENL